jgi:hypothetical protein
MLSEWEKNYFNSRKGPTMASSWRYIHLDRYPGPGAYITKIHSVKFVVLFQQLGGVRKSRITILDQVHMMISRVSINGEHTLNHNLQILALFASILQRQKNKAIQRRRMLP